MNQQDNKQESSRQKKRTFDAVIFRRFATLALAVASFLFLSACAQSSSERAEQTGGVTARQIVENPNAYIGKNVTVSGDVEEIYGPRAFKMDSGLTVGELLVVGREPFPQIPEAGNRAYVTNDVATVTGVVRMFVTADVEREIGWDLTPEIEAEFNAKPILIVQKAQFRPGAANRSSTADANMNQPMTSANQKITGSNESMAANANADQTIDTAKWNGEKITDIGVYASTADKLTLAGKNAQFTTARVVRVVGPRTFTVASGNEEIYVMLDESSARGVGTQGKISVGSQLNINGQFERLNAAEINQIADNRFRPLTEQERSFMKNTALFLQATQIGDLK